MPRRQVVREALDFGGDEFDQPRAFRFAEVLARLRFRAAPADGLVLVTARVVQFLRAADFRLGDAAEGFLQLARRDDLHVVDLNLVDAEVMPGDELLETVAGSFAEAGLITRERVVHLVACGGKEERVVEGVLDDVRGVREIEHVAQARLGDAITQRGTEVNDVLVAGDQIAVDGGTERIAGGHLRAGGFGGGGRGIPADGGVQAHDLPDGDADDFINRRRESPVRSRPEQLSIAATCGQAEAQNDHLFLRPDDEEA